MLQIWPSFVAYMISFLTIGAAWLGYTALTDRLARTDSVFLNAAKADDEEQRERRQLLPVILAYAIAILIALAFPVLAVWLYLAIAVYLVVPFREISTMLRRPDVARVVVAAHQLSCQDRGDVWCDVR